MKKLFFLISFVIISSANLFGQAAYNIGGSSADVNRGIATDGSNNVYITGYFQGSNVDFDPGTGTENLSSNGWADIFLAKYNSSGEYQWAFNIGGASGDSGYDIVVDGSGNVYITGHFQHNNVDFDPGIGMEYLSSNGSSDVFVAKYNSSGEYQWAFNIGGTDYDQGLCIDVDGSGNVYISGYFNGSDVDFDPGTGTANLSSNSSSKDVFFAKYNTDGEYQWAHNIGGTLEDYGQDIDVDGSNNVYITGYFKGSNVDFDPGAGTANLSSNDGSNDIFFAKYNSNGEYQWAYNIGGTTNDYGYGIEIDGSGYVYVIGHFQGSNVDFDPSAGTEYLSSNGPGDIFVAKYNSSGLYQWAFNIGGDLYDWCYGIVVDGSDDVYITGCFVGSNVDFNPGTGTANLSSNGGRDIYFAKYNSSGEYQWAHNIGGSDDDYGWGIMVDGSREVQLAGEFRGSGVDFDPGVGTMYLSSNGESDIYFGDGYSSENGVLPVALINFSASYLSGAVILNWTTEYEINNSGFEIEKKNVDDVNWLKIGFVEGQGTVNTPQNYTYSDRNLTAGVYNYRLKQIDNNGNYEYFYLSSDVIVKAPEKFSVFQNYPNPFNPKTSIRFTISDMGFTILKVYDVLGKEVTTLVNERLNAGSYVTGWDASNYPSGVYFYQLVTIPDDRQAEKFTEVKKMLLIK